MFTRLRFYEPTSRHRIAARRGGRGMRGGGAALVLCDEYFDIEEDSRASDQHGVLGSCDPARRCGQRAARALAAAPAGSRASLRARARSTASLVQAVALAEPVPSCELLRVVREYHGEYALEQRLVGRRDTKHPLQLRAWPMRSDARPMLTIIVGHATSRSGQRGVSRALASAEWCQEASGVQTESFVCSE